MKISAEELGFEHHIGFYRGLGLLSGDDARDATFFREAEYMHALRVLDAIRDIHLDAVRLGNDIGSPKARVHLNFGVGRRTKFIWLSLNLILRLCLPKREEPLEYDDVEEVARDLNVIYINIRGVLDNFSWCLIELFGDAEVKKLAEEKPTLVNIFSPQFQKLCAPQDLSRAIETFMDWNKDLKQRRDPAAHRIPLSVVPSIQDDSTKQEFERLQNEWNGAVSSAISAVRDGKESDHLFKKASALHLRLQSVGKFHPMFGHDPADGFMKIYPTLPNDIGQLVLISRGLFALISEKLDGRRAIVTALLGRAEGAERRLSKQ